MDNARDGGTDMVGPLVNQEEKSSVTIDNDWVEGGDNKIKGDSSCVLCKGGTWCSTRDCQARMHRCGGTDLAGKTTCIWR